MATKISLVCDVCGAETTQEEGRYTIAWSDQEVEIDLCGVHRAPLVMVVSNSGIPSQKQSASSALTRAKELAAGKGTRASTVQRTKSVHPDSRAVRAWAESSGIEVSDRGRIPNDIILKFQQAGN